jgi:hypothetical protein
MALIKAFFLGSFLEEGIERQSRIFQQKNSVRRCPGQTRAAASV